MSTTARFHRAVRMRDPRFDGKFFFGVKTTGIYCRPVCPAKPKRENIEFFKDRLSAERAGYRPCFRCRPESAERSAAWIGKRAIVNRAVKMIQSKRRIELDEDRFAALFGVSARHLRRVFVETTRKTPKQFSLERRLFLARRMTLDTRRPVTEIAFEAGFGSIRRFNDVFKRHFKKSPTRLRREKPDGKGKK
jgi:AraC family transcriptional regulator, regulatory protein of adaptative response / DNA-3-methyladenine glycosylase II